MNYWLVKSEPDEFSLEDLQKKQVEPWTGVRNYQARNFMRDHMKIDDPVLFYHSSIPQPCIVGLATVSSKPYPDPTQFDATSEYFDSSSKPEVARWIMIDIQFREIFPHPLFLSEVKADPALSQMRIAQKGSRLSVQPVEKQHFEEVIRRTHL